VKKRVFVAAAVDPFLIERLQSDPRLELDYRPVTDEQSLAGGAAAAQMLVTRYHNRVTAGVLKAASGLELIVQGTTGLDNIDLDAASGRGVAVVAIPGENANAVAEWVLSVMIALTRTIPLYDRGMRQGLWEREDCAARRELRFHRLGIIGVGRVGSQVARLAGGFGMQPLGYDPYVPASEVARRGAVKVDSLEELLRGSEILTLHVPLTGETAGMIGAPQLDLLPEGAVVINSARGQVLDQAAALQRLQSHHLGGLALDVYQQEPPQGLRWPDDPRLIVTPHIAGCSRESKESIGRLIYERICEFYGWEEL
jgi:D-3-phosphoglycerate dehydrogenase